MATQQENMIHPPFVHPIVDDGIDAAVGHCQPIEGQVHVWGVPGTNTRKIMQTKPRKNSREKTHQ